jgi:hypothetical protein
MAESTSRIPHKLEYRPCINTTIPSPTAIATYHSSFDYISEPRDCDTLVNINQDINHTSHGPTLQRDLRRLDIDSNQRIIETKNRKLDRTESISLPTTPTEQISPSYEYKYPRLTTLKNQVNNNDDDDDDDDQCFTFKLPPDYIATEPERDESISSSKK